MFDERKMFVLKIKYSKSNRFKIFNLSNLTFLHVHTIFTKKRLFILLKLVLNKIKKQKHANPNFILNEC